MVPATPLLSLEKMIASFKLEKVGEGVASKGEPDEKDLAACKKLGKVLAEAATRRGEPPRQ